MAGWTRARSSSFSGSPSVAASQHAAAKAATLVWGGSGLRASAHQLNNLTSTRPESLETGANSLEEKTLNDQNSRPEMLDRLRTLRENRSVLALCVARGDKSCIEALGQIGQLVALQETAIEILDFMLMDVARAK